MNFIFRSKVVNGSPLKALAHHEPLCSFDTNGRYVGLASLVQLLGGTPDAIEPESPDYFYEPAVSVPAFEQQSVEQAQSSKPAYDLQQILTQVNLGQCEAVLIHTFLHQTFLAHQYYVSK